MVTVSTSSCANTKQSNGGKGKESQCVNTANQLCASCKLVLYCSKQCQKAHWPHHKKICKSDLMRSRYVPGWIKQGRLPNWISDSEISAEFGVNQYLWGNMPAVNVITMNEDEGVGTIHHDISLLFAASGDIRNVVKSITEGLPDGYNGRCSLVINDINYMVVARNIILLFLALSLEVEAEEAAEIMIHVWYSALLPSSMVDKLRHAALRRIVDVCEKINDKPSHSLQAKTFLFGKRSLRVVLKKHQWDGLKEYFSIPKGLSQEGAQAIRRRCMLAPERADYLHRALCNQPCSFRVATVTFREDGILLPHGASRDMFDTPNPTFFHGDDVWPMKDDAGPLEGWNHYEYIRFASRATNDIIGSLFFFLRDMLSRFCNRMKDANIHFTLFNVDAQELPRHLNIRESQFDCIEVSNICDRGYLGPEEVLSTFSPLMKPKIINPNATLLMLFINAVGETYLNREDRGRSRFRESEELIKKLIPVTPMTFLKMSVDPTTTMSTPDMIRISSTYTMFGDFDAAFAAFSKAVQLDRTSEKNGVKVRKKHSIIDPWPLRVTESTTKQEFDILCASTHTGSERYVEFERM
ncbi:hypothetical protein BX600DRAFT_429841 [Xylariales sp. PMI_506]|nr:hypothetical protein BX600DRAFT_429841 [Xylariales sp. PMI_506]